MKRRETRCNRHAHDGSSLACSTLTQAAERQGVWQRNRAVSDQGPDARRARLDSGRRTMQLRWPVWDGLTKCIAITIACQREFARHDKSALVADAPRRQRPLHRRLSGRRDANIGLWEFPGKVEAGETPGPPYPRIVGRTWRAHERLSAPLTFASHVYPEFQLLMPLTSAGGARARPLRARPEVGPAGRCKRLCRLPMFTYLHATDLIQVLIRHGRRPTFVRDLSHQLRGGAPGSNALG